MIEEPYRWVEAIANRREYIEHQLEHGSPIAALSFEAGVLLVTLGRDRQKLFEIHDRIALGAIGHPADIERLRMSAIEVAGTEGFARSSQDVSLRRLANYSLSPALKAAFEQIYGAPYLVRMLFAEVGQGGDSNLFLRMDYDGAMHGSGGAEGILGEQTPMTEGFGVISGNSRSTGLMENFLRGKVTGRASLKEALELALDTWAVGHLGLSLDSSEEIPSQTAITEHRIAHLAEWVAEAVVLERDSPLPMRWRGLRDKDVRILLS